MLTKILIIVGVSIATVVAMFLWGKTMDGKPDEANDANDKNDANTK